MIQADLCVEAHGKSACKHMSSDEEGGVGMVGMGGGWGERAREREREGKRVERESIENER